MNYVVLSPQFPPNYVAFSQHLRRMGVTVLGLGDEPFERLPVELRQAMNEYYRVTDLHKYDELVRGLGYLTHRYGKLDRLESHNEYWLETDAQLREDFNITGLRPAHLAAIKRKSEMKRIFVQNGIPAARGCVCRSLAEGLKLASETGYPLVAKPDIGVGANKTYKIRSETDLEMFFEVKPPVDYMLEEFIHGALMTYDGLVDANGQVVFSSAMLFSGGIMEMVNEGLDLWYYTLRDVPVELDALGRKLVDVYGLRERFFHFEFFYTSSGKYIILEVNMRPPGGLTTDMWNYANDIDIYAGYASMVTQGGFPYEARRPYHCAYVGRRSGRTYALTHAEVLEACGDLLVQYEPISGIFAPALGDFGYVLRTPNLEVLRAGIQKIQQKF